KVAPPFKDAEFDILYGRGISKEGEMVDLGVKYDVIQKSGAWFSYGDMRLGQGRDNVRELFSNSPELAEEIETKINTAMREAAEAAKAKKPARPAVPAPPAPEPTTKAGARAKLDIVVDDDE
ncbi:MAG: DNA recombination/repair protein RecA, partial [Clostridia bacterium]|nr:DNA recombination/repair protein RecA [Clostridia bacterium]